ncbi:MAG: hypothetical protein QOH96_1065 [Blastocatellia bacterium]|nr:hypothetical protein [Blastocatellia bacterium]
MEAVQIGIVPHERKTGKGPPTPAPPFKAGDKFIFDLVVTNISYLPVRVMIFDTDVQNRPQLLMGGQVLSYREEIEKILKAGGDGYGEMLRMDSIVLAPNESRKAETVILNDWYNSLEPGHYQLTVQHRFDEGDNWIASPSCVFEVLPNPNK